MTPPTTRRVRLRPGIEVIRLAPDRFMLLDPPRGTHFELGAEERYLLFLFERDATPDEVVEAYQARFGTRLARHQLLGFLEQLDRLGLTSRGEVEDQPRAAPELEAPPAAEPNPRVNLAFDLLVVVLGWVVHPVWIPVLLVMGLMASCAILNHWVRLLGDLSAPLHRYPAALVLALSYLQTMLFINLPTAVLIGIACRRHRGWIRSFGLTLYRGIVPTFRCDCRDAMAGMSERGSWTLLSVPLWYQVGIMSFAVLNWCMSRPGSGAAIFWAYLVPPFVIWVVLNSYIFRESFGYWMICHATKEYGLRSRALAETSAWIEGRDPPEALSDVQRYWFRVYGLGCLVFQIVVEPAVFLFASVILMERFGGVGALIAVALLVWVYHESMGEFLMGSRTVRQLVRWGGSPWLRWSCRLALIPGFLALGYLPYAHEIVGECRVVPVSQCGIRAQLADEIGEILVAEGDLVEPGDRIATLVGRNVRSDLATEEAALKEARASLDLLLAGPRGEDLAIANDQIELRTSQLEVKERAATRVERLHKTGMASVAELDRAQAERDEARINLLTARNELAKLTAGYREESIRGAQAEVEQHEQKLKYLNELLGLTVLTTPIRGRVTLPYLEQRQGQVTKPGDLLAVVQDTTRLRVEVAADDAAAVASREGMLVRVRLRGLYGQLLTGRVLWVAPAAEPQGRFGISPVRSDQETYQEQLVNNHSGSWSYHLRVLVELDEIPPGLTSEMTGYARIVINEDDVLWRAFARPIARLLRTDVWSWLP